MEKICTVVCVIAAIAFLVIALLGAWRYFFISGICLAAGALVSDKGRENK